MFRLLSGAMVSLNELTTAHKERRLSLVSRDETRSGTTDKRIWLPANEAIRRVIRAQLGKQVPSGDKVLDAWHRAARRRERLPVVPAVPGQSTHARMLTSADGATYWIGLGSRGERSLLLEWRLEERIIQQDIRPSPVPLLMRVSDRQVQADSAFEKLMDNGALRSAEKKAHDMVPCFMLAIARCLGASDAQEDGLVVSEPEEARWAVIRWAADQKKLGPAWDELRLVSCTDGSRVGPVQLKKAAVKGPIRVVDASVTGRSIDPDRPVVQCARWQRAAISQYGSVEDYTHELHSEERAHRRWDKPGKKRTPPSGANVVLTVEAPGEREGYLQVLRDGKNEVQIAEHWRAVGTVSQGGPIPLVGFVSDDRIRYNLRRQKPIQDASHAALLTALSARSKALLPQLLPHLCPKAHRLLILKMASRAFSSRKSLKTATKDWGRLVDLQVLEAGDGTPMSLRAVADLPGDIRWVPQDCDAPSINKARPFVRISADERGLLVKLLPGTMMEQQARQERGILSRKNSTPMPFVLPSAGSYLRERTLKHGRISAKLGLRGNLQGPGTLEVRCNGVIIDTITPDAVGLFGVVEVPEGHVSEDWSKARLPAGFLRQVRSAHREMFAATLPQIRKRPDLLMQLAEVLEAGSGGRDLISNAALIETSDGWISARGLRNHKVFLLRQGPPESRQDPVTASRPLTVLQTPQSLKLVEAAGLTGRAVLETRWLEGKAAEEENAQRLRDHNRRSAIRDAVGQHVHALSRDLPRPAGFKKAVRAVSLEDCPVIAEAMEGDEQALVLAAAWAMAPLLAPGAAVSLMARVAEQLVGHS
jgi:hypothetical protein